MSTDPLEQLSEALADRLAAASPFVVAIRTGRRDCSGILWRDDVVVTSEQLLPDRHRLHRRPRRAPRLAATPRRLRRRHQRRRAAPGAGDSARRCRPPRLPSRRLAGADRRRGRARCADRPPRHGARHRPGMAQPGRRPHRGAAAAGRASRRRRGRAGADPRRQAARHVHLRPAAARAGDPGGHHRRACSIRCSPRAVSPAAGSASGCSTCWSPSASATRRAGTPA